jgi:hypothetical protein
MIHGEATCIKVNDDAPPEAVCVTGAGQCRELWRAETSFVVVFSVNKANTLL